MKSWSTDSCRRRSAPEAPRPPASVFDIEKYYRDSHRLVRWIEERRIEALVSFAALGPGDELLEVGCGAGHVLQHFEDVVRTGVDLSASMLDSARRRLGSGVALVRASADRLPFRDGAFPAIVCTELLEHTPDPGAVLRELLRVTGEEGRAVVSIPNESNIDRVKRWIGLLPGLSRLLRNHADEDNEWHLHRLNLSVLQELILHANRPRE